MQTKYILESWKKDRDFFNTWVIIHRLNVYHSFVASLWCIYGSGVYIVVSVRCFFTNHEILKYFLLLDLRLLPREILFRCNILMLSSIKLPIGSNKKLNSR